MRSRSHSSLRSNRLAHAIHCLLPVALVLPLPLNAWAAAQTVADADTPVLEVVEAERPAPRPVTAESLEAARLRLSQRAGATALIDAETWRAGRSSTLVDALAYAPGVFVQPRFGAEEARIAIRGSGVQRTFHGRGLELLQDGSPLNLADGGFDMQAVEPLSTRYVEVYRGANALEYGAATLGGAINFVSPTGHDAAPLTLRVEGGSFGYARAQVAVAGAGERADGYLSAAAFGQDGFREHAQQETYRVFGNAGWRFSEALDGRVYLSHVDTRSELPGALTLAEVQSDARQAAPGNLALDQRRDFVLSRIGSRLGWRPDADQQVVFSWFYADKSLHHPIFQVLNQDTEDLGLDLRWVTKAELAGRRNQLTAGLGWVAGDVDDQRFVNVAGRAGAPTNRFDQRAATRRAYVENLHWLSPSWVLATGGQWLEARRRSTDRLITGGLDESFQVDYSGFSPKLGLRFDATAQTQWFANLSRSLEPPSFSELTGGPNVTLNDQQRATSVELGLRMQGEALSLDAALYRARVDDELLALTDGAGNPRGTVNAERTLHQGLELGLGWTFAEQWSLAANALWNDFRFDGDAVYGDNELAGIPPIQVRMALRWSPSPALQVAPQVEWVPQDTFVDHANSFAAPGYTTLGLRLGGEMDTRWSWFVDLRNLTDRTWVATTNVVADARGLDGRNFLPGDGRSVYVGLQWRR